MLLPIREVSLPAALVGQPNGQLPAPLLVSTPGRGGGPLVRLDATATRAFRALAAAAAKAGHILQATSAADSYRPLSVQQTIFAQRYTTSPHEGWAQRTCKGVTYYQRPGTAMAACPGTSNHGLGLAIDLAGVDAYLDWLVAHELAYGFSHETVSEHWHIHYFTGDKIPAAVLAYEAASTPAPTPPAGGDDVGVMRFSFDGSVTGRPADVNDRIHLTDGVRYRILPDNTDWPHALLQSAGAGPVVTVKASDIGGVGTTYDTAVAALCGTLDTGEGGGAGLAAHTHAGGQTGPAVATP